MLSISDCSEAYCFEFFVKWGSSCRFPAFGIENYFIETTIGFDGPIDYILASTIQPSPSAAYLLFLNDKATSLTVSLIMKVEINHLSTKIVSHFLGTSYFTGTDIITKHVKDIVCDMIVRETGCIRKNSYTYMTYNGQP